jgi:hypothetical protein
MKFRGKAKLKTNQVQDYRTKSDIRLNLLPEKRRLATKKAIKQNEDMERERSFKVYKNQMGVKAYYTPDFDKRRQDRLFETEQRMRERKAQKAMPKTRAAKKRAG